MAKFFKRLTKDRVKFIVDFSAFDLTVTVQDDSYIKLQVQRGDQKPENLPPVFVRTSGLFAQKQVVKFARNKTPFECSYFIKDGVPEPKTCKLTFFKTDAKGQGKDVISSVEINFSNHFGAQFEQATAALTPTPSAEARGIICEAIRYQASIQPRKDKDADVLQQMVAWRERVHQEEIEEKARVVAEQRRVEEQKRNEQLRLEALRLERERKAAERTKQEPVRGLNAFKQSSAPQEDQSKSKSHHDTLLAGLVSQKQKKQARDKEEQVRPSTTHITNNLEETVVLTEFKDVAEERKSENRSAVRADLRASDRSAVKRDLRQGSHLDAQFRNTVEPGEGEDDDEDAAHTFDRLLHEHRQSQVQKEKSQHGSSEDQDAEIASLEAQIAAAQKSLARRLELEKQLEQTQMAIRDFNSQTELTLKMQSEEKQALQHEIKELQSRQVQLHDQAARQLAEAEADLALARAEFAKAQREHEDLERRLLRGRKELEDESNGHSEAIAQMGELVNQQTETMAHYELAISSCHQKQEQINDMLSLAEDIEREMDNTNSMIYEAEEKMNVMIGSQLHEERTQTALLKRELAELEKQKYTMQQESSEMRSKGIELQVKINVGQEKLKNLSRSIVSVDNQIEEKTYERHELQQAIEQAKQEKQEREAQKLKLKKQMLKNEKKKAHKRQQSQKEAQERKETQLKLEAEQRREAERKKAAQELQEQFNKANQSFFSEHSAGAQERVSEHDESLLVQDKALLLTELTEQMTPRVGRQMWQNPDILNESQTRFADQSFDRQEASQKSIINGGDLSFYSEGRVRSSANSFHQQSYHQMSSEDGEEGLAAFSFDTLMREKGYRENPNQVDHNVIYDSNNLSFHTDRSKTSEKRLPTHSEPQHFQTPPKEAAQYFGTTDIQNQQQTTAKAPSHEIVSPPKSVTEPNEDSNGKKFSASQPTANRDASRMNSQAEWLNYEEQDSHSPLVITTRASETGEDNLLRQIQRFERSDTGRLSESAKNPLLLKMDALEAESSGNDSFHSDDADQKAKQVQKQDNFLPLPQKDWLGTKALTSIREDRADSVMTMTDSDEEMQIIRVSSAVEANLKPEQKDSGGLQTTKQVSSEYKFGAVGPQETLAQEKTLNLGSVQVATRDESPMQRKSSEESPQRSPSFLIRQKILLATSPRSQARAIAELKEELVLVKQQIEMIQTENHSPERSTFAHSQTAVPVANRSKEQKLAVKYAHRDLIEQSLKTLSERDKQRKTQFRGPASLSHKSVALEEEEKDPYAPSESSSFLGSSQRGNFRDSLLNRSRFSSVSSSRGSVRGSVYSSTGFDRQRGSMLQGKSRRQVFTEMAMRDMLFMLVSGRNFFSCLSDFELMTGFNQFESMLKMDTSCHEAMYGLGKLNFLIKRYELAERWFKNAYAKKRDKVYRAWLGFTYLKLSQVVTLDNPNRAKYLEDAVRNLTRCVRDDDLDTYCIFALLFLAIELQKEIPNMPQVAGLEEPSKYVEGLKTCFARQLGNSSVEMTLAQAYYDLNTPGRIQQGVSALNKTITVNPERPEPYLMLSKHYSDRGQLHEEKTILSQALNKATQFQSYPERLMLTLLYAKNLSKQSRANDQLEAAQLLQLQHTRTPHYAASLLYAYGKTIVKCNMQDLLPNAISALEEAQQCSTSLRTHNCFAYVAKAYQLLSAFPRHACLFALQYQGGCAQLTSLVGKKKPSKKETMVAEILQGYSQSEQVLHRFMQAVQDAVASTDANVGHNERPMRRATLSFVEPRRTSLVAPKQYSKRLNLMTSPLQKLVTSDSEAVSAATEAQGADLLRLASKLGQARERLICKELILRGFQKESSASYSELFQELLHLRDDTRKRQDVEVQTLFVRCFRKSKLFLKPQAGAESMHEAMALVEMAKNARAFVQGRVPLTTKRYVDALIEAAKLLFALSRLDTPPMGLSAEALVQLVLHVLLSAYPTLPQVDFKLGNPQLPIDVDQFCFQDIEMIDFSLEGSVMELARSLQEQKVAANSRQFFSQSPLVQIKLQCDQLMLQGNIPIDAHKSLIEVGEDQTAIFSFPQRMQEGTGADFDLPHWSSTSVSAIVSFLTTEGISVAHPNLKTMMNRLAQFHVHSRPDLLRNIGKTCLKAGIFADLGILAFKECLVMVTYQKMFSLGAGQTISDQATVQSGYTLIRDRTMLLLAQSFAQLAGDLEGRRKADSMESGKALLTKVRNGQNSTQLRELLNATQRILKQ